MATELDVFNQALDMIGAKPAETVSDTTDRAETCARNIDQAIEELLRVNQWNFAKFSDELTEASPAPDFGWDHRFNLPTDFVSLIKLNGYDISNEPGDFYELENGYLLTDETEAKVQYIRKPSASGGISKATMLAQMDPMCVNALATLLAAKISPTLRQDGREAGLQLLQQYFQSALPLARRYDGSEQKPRRYDPASESNFIRARYMRSRLP
jgi:hypothetical protein